MGKSAWSVAVGLGLWAVACGGASENDFDAPPAAGRGGSSGGSGGSGGTMGGSKSAGGTTGKGGTSGKGGTTGSGGTTGGDAGSGTGGSGSGGMGTGGMETGGASGSSATGGMGATGGSETGGTSGTGGSGMESGGSAGTESGGTGGSGMETGGGSGVGGSFAGRAGSGGTPNCDELAEQYAKLLAEAQVCNPEIDRPQCTVEVQSSLLCGCPTWANVDNAEAIEAMRKIEQQASGCIVPCPAILCVAPGTGICTSSGGSGGHCTNSGLEI